jgi:cold shock CspA family protein
LVPDADGFHSDVFFHFKDLPPDVDVERGTILDFEIKTQPDGRVRATNITLS